MECVAVEIQSTLTHEDIRYLLTLNAVKRKQPDRFAGAEPHIRPAPLVYRKSKLARGFSGSSCPT